MSPVFAMVSHTRKYDSKNYNGIVSEYIEIFF